MHRLIAIGLGLLFVPFSVSAAFKNDVMEPWIGATNEELVEKWGYPQSANDLLKIDDTTTIYTYRSNRSLGSGPHRNFGGGPTECVISFTVKNNVVTRYKYEGGNCPKIKRQ